MKVIDLLRLDLFRKRPQLYQIRIVVVVRQFLKRQRWSVELLRFGTNETGRWVWNLNYSRSSEPVARLRRRHDREEHFLFFQLYRTGAKRANMPDIALMPSADPRDTPIWIVDPKHSERRRDRRRHYSDREFSDVAAEAALSKLRERGSAGIANPRA